MQTTLSWIARNRRTAVLGTALALTLAAGVSSRALTRQMAGAPHPGSGGVATSLFASQGPVRLAAELEGTKLLRGGEGVARVELSIAGHSDDPAALQRVPSDVIVVLDRSGSMEGEKLARAKTATSALLSEMGADDLFALVAYANDAVVAIPATPVTPANREWLDSSVSGLGVEGGTNIAAALELGLRQVGLQARKGHAVRMILISDGMANVGDTSLEGLTGRAHRASASSCVVSSIGVGSDFDERVMAAIADAGTGNFYYLDEQRDLAQIFTREFGAARATLASALQVEITPAPGVRVVDAAGYPLERDGDTVRFTPGALFDGQDRRIWVTLAVSEGAASPQSLGRFGLRYERDGQRESLELPEALAVSWAERQEEVVRSYAPAAWGRSVVQEEYGELESKVAEYVRQNEPQRALAAIGEFKQRVDAVNGFVQSPAVTEKLGRLEGLEQDVNDAFTGANQAEKRNQLSKAKAESSLDARRQGAKGEGSK
ncbi:MAG TPA: VWA domain-containing protein [Myxococcota bacterium]|nr:VWA domain-containing protein [Myxococcota bacterium]